MFSTTDSVPRLPHPVTSLDLRSLSRFSALLSLGSGLKCGYLLERSRTSKSFETDWRRRWFVLKERQLFHYSHNYSDSQEASNNRSNFGTDVGSISLVGVEPCDISEYVLVFFNFYLHFFSYEISYLTIF